MRAGTPDLIRDLNRTLVLNLLREHEGLSRADLARASRLSPSTVTSITAELIRDGFVLEDPANGGGRKSGIIGRPATALRVNPNAGYVVGVKLAAETVTAALTDLAGEPITFHTAPRRSLPAAEETARSVGDAVEAVMDRARRPVDRLLGVGVGLPGIVDPDSGIVDRSPLPELNGLNIARLVAGRVRVPVHVDNDVNTLTIAEHLFGAGRGLRHLLVVSVGRGIGMGLVVNGALYRGGVGGAGEFGHVTIDPAGAACWCGRRGCLETLATEGALVAAVAAATGQHIEPDLLAGAAQSDDRIGRLLGQAGTALGRAIRNVIGVLDPERVVVSGEGVRLGDQYLEAMRNQVLEGGAEGTGSTDITIEPWGDEAWARGAASLVLGELFHPAHLPQPQALRPGTRAEPRSESAIPAQAGSRR